MAAVCSESSVTEWRLKAFAVAIVSESAIGILCIWLSSAPDPAQLTDYQDSNSIGNPKIMRIHSWEKGKKVDVWQEVVIEIAFELLEVRDRVDDIE